MAEPAGGAERAVDPGERPDIQTEVERRRSARSPMVVRVCYSTIDALFSEFSRNINEGGVFIETETPPAPDTRVALNFQLPGSDEPIQARGRVAWIRPASAEGPAGMGVEFEHLSADARARIDSLVRRLRSAG
jgi:uncharacterized protein (TIGR02266 family)